VKPRARPVIVRGGGHPVAGVVELPRLGRRLEDVLTAAKIAHRSADDARPVLNDVDDDGKLRPGSGLKPKY
jgi:hypothetical protein